MLADVEETAEYPILAPHDDDRIPCHIGTEELAFLPYLRRVTDPLPGAAEDGVPVEAGEGRVPVPPRGNGLGPLDRLNREVSGWNGREVDDIGLHDVYYPLETSSAPRSPPESEQRMAPTSTAPAQTPPAPVKGESITMVGGKLNVPAHPIIPFIEGDGIGPDIWRASKLVLDSAVKAAYGGKRQIAWQEVLAGEKAKNRWTAGFPTRRCRRSSRNWWPSRGR